MTSRPQPASQPTSGPRWVQQSLFDVPPEVRPNRAKQKDPHPHPALFSIPLLSVVERLLAGRKRILDPFAGEGTIHRLRARGFITVAVEIQWKGAERCGPGSVQGNAMQLPFADSTFDGIFTSPTFANRMADQIADRHTYYDWNEGPLNPMNIGRWDWHDDRYRLLSLLAWAEVTRVSRPGARLVLDIKDSTWGGKRNEVTERHCDALVEQFGWQVVERVNYQARGLRHGANRDRVPNASLIAFVLDALLPQPLNRVHEREAIEREATRRRLR